MSWLAAWWHSPMTWGAFMVVWIVSGVFAVWLDWYRYFRR